MALQMTDDCIFFFPVIIGTAQLTMAIGTVQRMMARQLYLFFSGRNWNGVTTDRQLYLFFPVVIGTAQQWQLEWRNE